MQRCPACASFDIRRSRSQSAVERIWKRFTMQRLFRCMACGWRGWGEATPQRSPPLSAGDTPHGAPDLQGIDAALHK